ncbi:MULTISPECIES: WD40 repeat domain-containing protein [unclassified Streptomyces]|uniref:WD40 repeat domain-containing protein n=1 Tax=unclassified Streptomyces TaxID=2593676 RepID=UPI00224F03D9|nr:MULTISPECIES: WD40 repeat domain-containing protein [unclassified Streptomyces]MCX4526505.1 WD40 repeat domain-containing protein [Streptomyces sp. NBC_01551]MCX4542932.1 WD40 repeat domain-containing protein [Streptomyces sp. NBC_01565]
MRLLPPLTAFSAAAVLALMPGAAAAAPAAGGAAASGFTITDPRIKESSGLAASRIHPGVYWTHNDSDDGPYVYAVDSATGKTVARVTLTGIGKPRDVEAISLGPDGALYVGDIGDNRDGTWDHVWIYRFQEPKELRDATVKAEQFTVRYEGGARNAEALMVHPVTGRVYIASKSEDKGGLYEGPATLSASGTNVFRRVAEMPWVTDGAFSPDGTRLTVRGYFLARTYAWKDGRPQGQGERIDAPWQGQAESVTYTADGSALMFGAEGASSRVVAVPVGSSSSSPSGSPTAPTGAGGGQAGAGPSAAGEGGYTKTALVLAAATALVFGAKRVLRRRPKP